MPSREPVMIRVPSVVQCTLVTPSWKRQSSKSEKHDFSTDAILQRLLIQICTPKAVCTRHASGAVRFSIVYKYRSFLNPEQWVWCVNIETGSTRTQTIPDATEKDATSQNQTHACATKTHRTQPWASSLTLASKVWKTHCVSHTILSKKVKLLKISNQTFDCIQCHIYILLQTLFAHVHVNNEISKTG